MEDDRTARARLRDAAIELVAEAGAPALTARGVAHRAGLSAGLIRHHFGSMADLLTACDEYVSETIKELKQSAVQQTAAFDALSTIRQSGNTHLMGYLAMRLADDSPQIDELVDTLVDDAAGYMAEGAGSGVFTDTPDHRNRAAMLTVYALGSLSLHRHLDRLLSVDIRATDLASQPGFAEYLRLQVEVFSGVLTPSTLELYGSALNQLQEES